MTEARTGGRRVLAWLALAAACAGLFVILALGSGSENGLPFDDAVLTWLATQQNVTATRLALTLDLAGISYLLVPASILLAVALSEAGHPRAGLFLIASELGAVALNLAAKAYFLRERPELAEGLTPVTNASFPSGHAMGSFAFAAALVVIVSRLRPRHRGSIGAVLLLFTLGVGLSRMYLQVHYPSDVLAAWCLSGFWVAMMVLWYPPTPDPSAPPERAGPSRGSAPPGDP